MARNSSTTLYPTTLATILVTASAPSTTVSPHPMDTALLLAYIALFLLRAVSFITTCTVIYSILRGNEFLNPIIRTSMCTMYCSSFISDISYCIVLYTKTQKQEIFVRGMDLNPFLILVIFYHELGFATFVMGIFFTATERLINSRSDFYLRHKMCTYLLAVGIIPVILACSAVYANGLTDLNYNVMAAIAGAIFFFVAAIMLFLAVYFSVRAYRRGLGQPLTERFKSASTYYFNRHLFISLVGEIFMRSIAYSFMFALATGITPAFETTSFCYHNLLAVGNCIFPWLIILRHGKSTLLGSRNGRVTDLTGNQLRLRANAEEYHNVVVEMWR